MNIKDNLLIDELIPKWFYTNEDYTRLFWKESPSRVIKKDKEILSHRVKTQGVYFNKNRVINYFKTGNYYNKSDCISCGKQLSESNRFNKKYCSHDCAVSYRTKHVYKYKYSYASRNKSPKAFMSGLLTKKYGERKELSLEFLEHLYNSQKGLCAISGVPMTYKAGRGRVGTNISIDQIKAGQGYTENNVQLVTCDVNRIKGVLTMDELYDLCKSIVFNRSKQPKRDGSHD